MPFYHKKFPLKYQKAVFIVKGSMNVLIPLRRIIFITFTFSVNFSYWISAILFSVTLLSGGMFLGILYVSQVLWYRRSRKETHGFLISSCLTSHPEITFFYDFMSSFFFYFSFVMNDNTFWANKLCHPSKKDILNLDFIFQQWH